MTLRSTVHLDNYIGLIGKLYKFESGKVTVLIQYCPCMSTYGTSVCLSVCAIKAHYITHFFSGCKIAIWIDILVQALYWLAKIEKL